MASVAHHQSSALKDVAMCDVPLNANVKGRLTERPAAISRPP